MMIIQYNGALCYMMVIQYSGALCYMMVIRSMVELLTGRNVGISVLVHVAGVKSGFSGW